MKFCKDCKWVYVKDNMTDTLSHWTCLHPSVIVEGELSLITGQVQALFPSCERIRLDAFGKCGPSAALFDAMERE